MSFEIVPADVIAHAGAVEGLSGELTKAGEQGAGVDLGIETYGIIGQLFSGKVRTAIDDMGEAIAELASALPDIADALRDCADSTRETDEHHANLFDQALKGE
jgi:hypothetical protein